MAGPANQINHHVAGRLADSDGLGNPVFQHLFQVAGNFLPVPSTGSNRCPDRLHNPLNCQSPVDFETQLN
jgi:hypothetical protein